MIGSRNASVLPDPVPVVTSVDWGRPFRLESRRNADAWCAYALKPGGIQSSGATARRGAGPNGIPVRR